MGGPAGKLISGDSKGSGANYSYNAKNTGTNTPAGGVRSLKVNRMNNKDREFKVKKANMRKG